MNTATVAISGLNFVAVDVETANRVRGSVCSIGYAVVRDGIRIDSGQWLCRPPDDLNHFDAFNVALHGISPADVMSEPYFQDRLDQLLGKVGDQPVVAHNAAFDVGALRVACDLAGTVWPTLEYGCSLVWSRRLLNLISYSLPYVADNLGVYLDSHHDAAADAAATADITIALARRESLQTISDLASHAMTRLGHLTPMDWSGCRALPSPSGGGGRPIPTDANPNADPNNPLFGQVMAFTGALMTMTRQEAFDRVAQVGAVAKNGVTSKTTRLVIGDGFAGTTPDEFCTGKAAAACHWRDKGKPIEVLTEPEFLSYLSETESSGVRRAINRRRSNRRVIQFDPAPPETWFPEGSSQGSLYWRWWAASLAAGQRAVGGEPCRICGDTIVRSTAWKLRDRHVCSPKCNSTLKREFVRAINEGRVTRPDALLSESARCSRPRRDVRRDRPRRIS